MDSDAEFLRLPPIELEAKRTECLVLAPTSRALVAAAASKEATKWPFWQVEKQSIVEMPSINSIAAKQPRSRFCTTVMGAVLEEKVRSE